MLRGSEKERAIVVRPEVNLRPDLGVITARHVVRNEIDQRLELVGAEAREEGFEFREALRRIDRVVGTDIEVILDRIGAAGDPLEQNRVVGRLANIRMIGAGRLLQDARQPDVGKTEGVERGERRIIDVVEFADAVDGESAIGLAGFVQVAE